MDLEQIKQCIPHRDPFIWIEEVLEIEQNSIHATKHLNPELELFKGHYPDFPILPGVIQCEMAMQAGAILIARMHAVDSGKIPVATRMNNVKFKHMIRPGDTVHIFVEITETVSNAFYLTGKVKVDGKLTARLDFAVTTTDSPS
ncbi:MAG: beta-hydroxyacyl-ACP dehydratase [Planctomycetaceae bacterium]|nr:beta-hydroxyacyl-ACP dehydratase [Planctomycetaceae bacterium]